MTERHSYKWIAEYATKLGLYVDDWAPGDGVRRIRIFTHASDYFAGDGIYTALGTAEAETFLRGYAAANHVLSNG